MKCCQIIYLIFNSFLKSENQFPGGIFGTFVQPVVSNSTEAKNTTWPFAFPQIHADILFYFNRSLPITACIYQTVLQNSSNTPKYTCIGSKCPFDKADAQHCRALKGVSRCGYIYIFSVQLIARSIRTYERQRRKFAKYDSNVLQQIAGNCLQLRRNFLSKRFFILSYLFTTRAFRIIFCCHCTFLIGFNKLEKRFWVVY